MRFRKPINYFILAIGSITLVSLVLYIPVWQADAKCRRNKNIVNDIITVGQNLDEAQQQLENAGFELVYDKPITPTANEDYLLQLVIVGETQPNTFETFAYVEELSWFPFTRSESAYVRIRAGRDGIIISIE